MVAWALASTDCWSEAASAADETITPASVTVAAILESSFMVIPLDRNGDGPPTDKIVGRQAVRHKNAGVSKKLRKDQLTFSGR